MYTWHKHIYTNWGDNSLCKTTFYTLLNLIISSIYINAPNNILFSIEYFIIMFKKSYRFKPSLKNT